MRDKKQKFCPLIKSWCREDCALLYKISDYYAACAILELADLTMLIDLYLHGRGDRT